MDFFHVFRFVGVHAQDLTDAFFRIPGGVRDVGTRREGSGIDAEISQSAAAGTRIHLNFERERRERSVILGFARHGLPDLTSVPLVGGRSLGAGR